MSKNNMLQTLPTVLWHTDSPSQSSDSGVHVPSELHVRVCVTPVTLHVYVTVSPTLYDDLITVALIP